MTVAGQGGVALRARDFVLAHGDALQRARAAAFFDAASREAVRAQLAPFEDARGAASALAVLDALGVRRGAEVERAVELLSAAQRDDGSWARRDGDGDDARVVATAHVAGLLAKTPFARPALLRAAAAFLAPRWGPERVQSGDPVAIAAWAQWFANADEDLSDAGLQWCGRELERGFRSGAIDALAAARVFALCDAQALPGARLGAAEVVPSLMAAQAADGGFGAGWDPIVQRVEATLDALAALARLAPRELVDS
jgi:hypothetical protein